MAKNVSLFKDLKALLFSNRQFFSNRFTELTRNRLYALGALGLILGLVIGGVFTIYFSMALEGDLLRNPDSYADALNALSLKPDAFKDILLAQKAYAILLLLLSPVLAYMAPHIFGGALYLFLKLLTRNDKIKLDFAKVMDCAALSLGGMFFYMIPAFGPMIAPIFVGIYVSRALYINYKMQGFLKIMAVVSAIYICFFLSSASLQMLALPFAQALKL